MLLTRFKIIITTLYTSLGKLFGSVHLSILNISLSTCAFIWMCANGLQIKDIAKNEQQLVAKSFVATHKRIRRYSTN